MCLSEDSLLICVSEIREGIPISVITMIICPVKIESKDSLPKLICEECLEIVLSAYKLRDNSLKSDRYLRDRGFIGEFEGKLFKEEQNDFSESNIFVQPLTAEQFEDENSDVDCSSDSSNPLICKYMGPLLNAHEEIVDENFLYCRLCVKNSNFRKYPKSTASSYLLHHLKLVHRIDENAHSAMSGSYSCDLCSAVCHNKFSIEAHILDAHMGPESPNIDPNSWHNTSGYKVECMESPKSKSHVWQYFGKLIDVNGDEVEQGLGYNFCKLCVEKRNCLEFKYLSSNATSTLIRHLKLCHGVIGSTSVPFEENKDQKNRENVNGYKVDCISRRKAFVWRYFGKLVNESGEEAVEGVGHFYCKICVEERNSLGYKYTLSTATTPLIRHLKVQHEITNEDYYRHSPEPSSMPPIEHPNQGIISEDDIAEKANQNSDIIYNKTGYSVNCFKAAPNRSLVWNYFGKLVDSTGKVVDDKFLYCKLCVEKENYQKKYKTDCASHMLAHLKNHHNVGPGIMNVVAKRLRTNSRKRTSTDQESSTTICKPCDMRFESIKEYLKHLRLEHEPSEPSRYICHVCSKTFPKKYSLTKHLRLHDGINYKCPSCPSIFKYPEGTKKHMKIHDPTHWTRYRCDQCPKAYTELSTLKRHILAIHLNKPRERKHQCPYCEMKVHSSDRLQVHIKTHTGEVC